MLWSALGRREGCPSERHGTGNGSPRSLTSSSDPEADIGVLLMGGCVPLWLVLVYTAECRSKVRKCSAGRLFLHGRSTPQS